MLLDNEQSGILDDVEEIYLGGDSGPAGPYVLRSASRVRAGRWRISLAGVGSRQEASSLTGRPVLVAREALDLGEGELLVSELQGRQVVTGGEVTGVVRSVYFNGAHDVLVVEADPGLVDVPLVEQHVSGLDARGRLVIDGFRSFAEMAYSPKEGKDP